MNRNNLKRLATYLEGLPADYKGFEMEVFFEELKVRGIRKAAEINFAALDAAAEAAKEVEIKYARENGGVGKCGAVACAVGHGPAAGFLAIPEDFTPAGNMDWGAYQGRVFDVEGEAFSWCFGGAWSDVDNTPQGAAKRIRYMLAKGVPEGFDEDDDDCYADFVPIYQ